MKNTRKIIWYILFILTGSYLLLVKESGLIIFGLSSLWIIWNLITKEKSITSAIMFIAACALGGAASYALLAYSSGGAGPYLEIYRHIKEVVGTSSYGKEYQSGPWINFVFGLFVISPLSFILFLVGAAGTLVPFRNNTSGEIEARQMAAWLILFGIIFFSVFLVLPDSQNYRFVNVVFAPFYIIAGLGLWKLLELTKPFVKNISAAVMPILVIVIILAALWDYQTFTSILSNNGAIDLPVKNILDHSK